jgi:hypothetical protein
MRTPRGTGMGCNDLTSPVLQMRKYQTHQLQSGLRVLDVLLLRDLALLLATSLVLGVDIESCFLEQWKQCTPGWNFDGGACGPCKNRQVTRAR